jgi:predicted nucleic acid-binding protein
MSGLLYWDTSALLKLYAEEPDSSAYRALLVTRQEQPVVAFLHRVELYFALRHKEDRGEIAAGASGRLFGDFLRHVGVNKFREIPWGDDIAKSARDTLEPCLFSPIPVRLRSLDGLHLGALLLGGISKLVTTDEGMRKAAGLLGIDLVDP